MRRIFNKVGCPKLPQDPTRKEIISYIKDKSIREQLQPHGKNMDAREWAATCLNSVAEEIERKIG